MEQKEVVVDSNSTEKVVEPAVVESDVETKQEVVEPNTTNQEEQTKVTPNQVESETERLEKEKQSKEKNAEFARLRREKEAREQEIAKAKEEAYRSATLDSLNNTNPYTNEEITDDADWQEYLVMKEIAKDGGNPILDYSKYMKRKAKEESSKNEVVKKDDKWYENDRNEFEKAYPNTLPKLFEDKAFMEFAEEFVSSEKAIPLKSVYESYQKLSKHFNEVAEKKANDLYAKKISTPGSLKDSSDDKDNSTYSEAELKKITPAEYEANREKVERSYEAFRIKKMKK
jgi:hypothetical protein